MAAFIHIINDYNTQYALTNVAEYIIRKAVYVGGKNVMVNNCVEQMMGVKKIFNRESGKMLEHFVLSLSINEWLSFEDMYNVACMICNLLPEYQTIFGIHIADCYHIHFCVNTVNITDGRKLRIDYENSNFFKKAVRHILRNYNIHCNFHSEISTNEFLFSKAFDEIYAKYL